MRQHFLAIAACVAALTPSAIRAQGGSPPFNGPRGAYSFELSDGEPVSFYLEWSRQLELTDAQKTHLIEIRRRLRQVNASFMTRLDSIRELAGVDMTERARLTQQDADAMSKFRLLAKPVIDSIRINNDQARNEIRHLLEDQQMTRADSIAAAQRDIRPRRAGRSGPSAPPAGAPPSAPE
jgi:hypothetical protein